MLRNRLLTLPAAIAAAAVVSSASAAMVDVTFSPAAQSVDISAGTTTVDVIATISDGGGVIGWGLDLSLTGSSVSLTDVAINEGVFDGVIAGDGDDLAALVPIGSLADGVYTLATLTFSLDALGLTTLDASYTESDPTEGFPLDLGAGGGFAPATFSPGTITVTPEPSALALLALGALVLRRRSMNR